MSVSVILETRVARPATIVGPSSYATGGDPITPGDFKLSRIDVLVAGSSPGGYTVAYDAVAGKLVWSIADTDGTDEVAALTDLDAETVSVVAYGLP